MNLRMTVVEFLPADQVQKESMDSLTSVLEKLGANLWCFLLIYQISTMEIMPGFRLLRRLQNGLSQEDNSIIFYFLGLFDFRSFSTVLWRDASWFIIRRPETPEET